jgi:hypothetical protein
MLIMGTKAKHLIWSKKFSYRKQIVSVLAQKFWYEAKQFDLVLNCLGQNRAFLYNPKTYRSKQNVMI